MQPFAAALQGAREVGFTVLSMSLSLIAVFIPILLMEGIIGRLFREFAITLSVAILVSLAVSLTTTPMMCARLLRPKSEHRTGRFGAVSERMFADAAWTAIGTASPGASRHGAVVMLVTSGDGCAQYLSVHDHSQGLLSATGHGTPGRQHPGRPEHFVPGHAREARRFHDHRKQDPAVENVVGFTGGCAAQHRLHVRLVEAAVGAQGNRGSGDCAAARRSCPRIRAPICSCSRSRTSASAAGRATPNISTRCRATTSPNCGPGSPRSVPHSTSCRACRCQHRSAGQGPADFPGHRPRHCGAPRC